MKRILLTIAALVLTAGVAQAQITASTTRMPERPVGIFLPVYNTIDSVIIDGTLVVVDTTAVIKGLGVRPYLASATQRGRILGIAAGSIPRSTAGQSGKVLIYGFHPRARIGVGATSIGNLKASLSVHGSLTPADSVPMTLAWSFGNNGAAVSNGAYRARVFFWGNRAGAITL